MPILFGTLAALVMAIAAWTTYKNQDEYKHQIVLREKQEATRDRLIIEKKGLEEDLDREEADTEQLVSDNKTLTSTLEEKESARTTLVSEISKKEQDILTIKADVDQANEELKDLGDIENLVPKIKRIQGEIAQLEDDIEKEEANLASLKQVKKVTQAEISIKVGEAENIAQGKSQDKLATSIKTVYANWGFVTLNGGDVQGVVPGSTLDVVRGDEVVAKLKVTTVEPNRAAADIVRDSLQNDFFLRSGDKVVAEVEPIVEAPILPAPLGVQPAPTAPAPAPAAAAPELEDDPFQ